jgi:hypothetical protein
VTVIEPEIHDEKLGDEELSVRKMRRRRLLSRGLTMAESRLLSESRADLHSMEAMLDQGCDPRLLIRIFL